MPTKLAFGLMSSGLTKLERTKMRHVAQHAELDRAHLQRPWRRARRARAFLRTQSCRAAGIRHHARVGGVDAVDVGVDVAAFGADGRRNGDRRGVGAAAAERGDTAGRLVLALEAGDDGDLLVLREALDQLGAVDVLDARRGVRVVRSGSAIASPARSAR